MNSYINCYSPKYRMKQLSIAQLKTARQKALKNAEDLVKDAEVLFEFASYPRVLFLSHIAGEEIGKYIILTSTFVMLVAGKTINWRKFWKRITSHKVKLELITYMEDIYLDQPFPDSLKEYFKDLRKQVKDLDRFKQKSLYCDFTEEIPHCPSDLIGKNFAKNALVWAKGRLGLFTGIEKEIQKVKILDKITEKSIQEFVKKHGFEKFFKITNEK